MSAWSRAGQIGQGFGNGNKLASLTLHVLFSHVPQTKPPLKTNLVAACQAIPASFSRAIRYSCGLSPCAEQPTQPTEETASTGFIEHVKSCDGGRNFA